MKSKTIKQTNKNKKHRCIADIQILLTHWGRVTHICVSILTIISSDSGLSPERHQSIIWTDAGMLLIATLGTNFSEIISEIHTFSFTKMHLKTSSAKLRPFPWNTLKYTFFLWNTLKIHSMACEIGSTIWKFVVWYMSCACHCPLHLISGYRNRVIKTYKCTHNINDALPGWNIHFEGCFEM